ncbi:TonB-dependent receptor plug domain-containing protein [Polaribacter sargassicola]|uniref:TonB-dependent receptor plug domain-containing protein n=1 Tax=Polaribacter sargassicola TaxID=2836891 RepID=UPI001F1CFA00|nr:TonB-dependent receptor plug domain-containing protein [Polaribacter sp. DS7-9]MCG1035833.1 TonB-dependent receptor plug domain-containing protein [Polaribacter sp. DS7-9]
MKKIKHLSILVFVTFFVVKTFSQNEKESKNITITIKDQKNKPVPGAVILFDDVKQKRLANSKGIFKIKTTDTPKIISAFSPRVGIQKVSYKGESNITIIIKKRNDSYLVNVPKNKIDNAMQFNTIYDYLEGKIPGVNVSDENITIRGYNTINGSTTPLFILNGAQVDQSIFGQIVPTTIKSIVVLKGPETATYGVRGANGVIKVTTL